MEAYARLDCFRGAISSFGISECRPDVRNRDINFSDDPAPHVRLCSRCYSKSLLKSLSIHASEHYSSCSYGVYPIENDSAVAILLVANKYSPNNFWYALNIMPDSSGKKLIIMYVIRNGRFRAIYQVPVSSSSTTVTGKIHVHVHYYEDGNVALNTTKPVSASVSSVSAEAIMSRIAAAERDYQEELNRAFVSVAEGAFKGLRRQLPITRQKVEWEKVGGYRLGQDISGGKGR